MNPLTTVAVLAIINERAIEYFARPLKEQYPHWQWKLLLYVALVTGAAIGWLSGLNILEPLIENEILGRVMTAIAIGGGSSLLHEIAAALRGRGGLVNVAVEGDAVGGESPAVTTSVTQTDTGQRQ